MPAQKYRIDTDKGSYEIEVEVPEDPTTIHKGAAAGPTRGVLVDTLNAIGESGAGFVSGVGDRLLHPINTVTGLAKAGAQELGATVKGAFNLANDPGKTLTNAGNAVANIPHAIGGMVDSAVKTAGTDPEGFGREVGHQTADAEASTALLGGLKFAPKPVARGAGRLMNTIGKEAKWPLRMVGAHQLGSGNPMGVLTMAAPEALKKQGGALERWGTEVGAADTGPAATFLKLEQDLATGAKTSEQLTQQVGELQADLVKRRATAKLPEDIAAIQKEQTRLDRIKAKVQKSAPKPAVALGRGEAPINKPLATFREDVSKGVAGAIDQSPNASEKLSDLDSAIEAEKARATRTRTASQKLHETSTRAEQRADMDQYNAERRAAEAGEKLTPEEEDRLQLKKDGQPQNVIDAAMKAKYGSPAVSVGRTAPVPNPDVQAPPPRDLPDRMRMDDATKARLNAETAARDKARAARAANRARTEPPGPASTPPPKGGITIGGLETGGETSGNALDKTLLDQANAAHRAEATADPANIADRRISKSGTSPTGAERRGGSVPEKVPVKGKLLRSRSKSNPADEYGLTRSDYEHIGMDPDRPLPDMTEAQIKALNEKIAEGRASRAANHKETKGQAKGFQNIVDRDNK
jgi:hypothetical protein